MDFMLPMKVRLPRRVSVARIISAIVLGAYGVRLALFFAGLNFSPDYCNGFNVTEWLISYEGGFVRRGLLGQLLYEVCSFYGCSPFPVIAGICIVAWMSVMYFFFSSFKRQGYCWWLLLSPLFLGYVLDMVRKDWICYLIMIGMIYLARTERQDIWKYVFTLLLAVLGLFVHEAFIFLGVPVTALLLLAAKGQRWRGLVFCTAVLAVFFVLCHFKGSDAVALSVIDSWNRILSEPLLVFRHGFSSGNSISALGWDTVDAMKFHITQNFSNGTGGWSGLFIRPLFAVCVYYFVTNFLFVFKGGDWVQTVRSQTCLSALFILSMVCLLPMFTVLSCDYSRLYQYAFVATFAAFVILDPERVSSMFPKRCLSAVERFNRRMNRVLVPTKGLMVILLLLLSSYIAGYNIIAAFYQSILGIYCKMLLSVIDYIQGLI